MRPEGEEIHMGYIGERVGVIMRVSGTCEEILLGHETLKGKRLIDTVSEVLGGEVACEITSDGYAYLRLKNAYDDGLDKNKMASYYSGISVFGDCIVLPKAGEKKLGYWNYAEGKRRAVLFRELAKNKNYTLHVRGEWGA